MKKTLPHKTWLLITTSLIVIVTLFGATFYLNFSPRRSNQLPQNLPINQPAQTPSSHSLSNAPSVTAPADSSENFSNTKYSIDFDGYWFAKIGEEIIKVPHHLQKTRANAEFVTEFQGSESNPFHLVNNNLYISNGGGTKHNGLFRLSSATSDLITIMPTIAGAPGLGEQLTIIPSYSNPDDLVFFFYSSCGGDGDKWYYVPSQNYAYLFSSSGLETLLALTQNDELVYVGHDSNSIIAWKPDPANHGVTTRVLLPSEQTPYFLTTVFDSDRQILYFLGDGIFAFDLNTLELKPIYLLTENLPDWDYSDYLEFDNGKHGNFDYYCLGKYCDWNYYEGNFCFQHADTQETWLINGLTGVVQRNTGCKSSSQARSNFWTRYLPRNYLAH